MKIFELVARVWSGTPITAAIGKLSSLSMDTTRAVRVYLSQAIDRGSSSITGWEKPSTGIMNGTPVVMTGAAVALGANACISVTVQSRGTNVAATGIAVGGPAVPAPPAGGVVLIPGASFTPPGGVNNTNLVYCCGTIGEIVDFTFVTR